MDLGLKNKVIIVTGAARGIGDGIVRVLSEEGAIVAIVGRSQEDNLKLQNELEKSGGHVFSVEAELGEPAACEKAVDTIVQHYGRIEGLVNHAGVTDDAGPGAGNQERFMENLHMNLVHYYLMAHFAIPYLKISSGAIVNISSKKVETGQGNTSTYAAAHGGRNALTREWAVELLKYGIRVNAVIVSESYMPQHESYLRTFKNPNEKIMEIISENRMPKPSEIAHAVSFLLSEKSSHTTGQLIHVGGGNVYLDRAMANA